MPTIALWLVRLGWQRITSASSALDHHDQLPNVAPALKLPLESLTVCADAASHIAGGLALYHGAFRQGRQDNVASLKFLTDELPALGQELSPWVRATVRGYPLSPACLRSLTTGPPVEVFKRCHVVGVSEVEDILGIKG